MWFCFLSTLAAAASTFTAGAPTGHLVANVKQNPHVDKWDNATPNSHLQKRMFSKQNLSVTSQIDSGISIAKTPTFDPPATNAYQKSTPPSQSLPNPSLTGLNDGPVPRTPEPSIYTQTLHSELKDSSHQSKTDSSIHLPWSEDKFTPDHLLKTPNAKTRKNFLGDKPSNAQLSRSSNSKIPLEPPQTTPNQREFSFPQVEEPISSPPHGPEDSKKTHKWMEKVRKLWDKMLKKIRQLLSNGATKSKLADTHLPKITTNETPLDHAPSQSSSTTHEISEDLQKPTEPLTDLQTIKTSETPRTQASQLLSFNSFYRLITIRGCLTKYLKIFFNLLYWPRRKEPAPKSPPMHPKNPVPSPTLPQHGSLPVPSSQNHHESANAGSLQEVAGHRPESFAIAETPNDALSETPEGKWVVTALKHIDVKEMAEIIHKTVRAESLQLNLLSRMVSAKQVEEFILSYSA